MDNGQKTDEPAELKGLPDTTPTRVRLAVFETKDDPTPQAVVVLEHKTTWPPAITISGRDETSVKAIGSIAEQAIASAEKPDDKDQHSFLEIGRKTVERALDASGKVTQILPEADYQLSFQLDLDSGRDVSEQIALHRFNDPNASLAAKLHSAIATGLREPIEKLTYALRMAMSTSDNAAIVCAISDAKDSGTLSLPSTIGLLDALLGIDTDSFAPNDGFLIRNVRFAISSRLGRFDLAEADARDLLSSYQDRLDRDEQASLRIAIGIAAEGRGEIEAALAAWHDILEEAPLLSARNRAWAWRNISLALPLADPEVESASRNSADAFLEAGEKTEAAKSLKRLVDHLIQLRPAEVLEQSDKMLALLGEKTLLHRDLRAAALHSRALRLRQLGRHDTAFADASEAVRLRRGLINREAELVSSLYLAALEAETLGFSDRRDSLEKEADEIGQRIDNPHFRLAQRLNELMIKFDPLGAENLIREARAQAEAGVDIVAGVRIAQAKNDIQLSRADRLQILEASLRDLSRAKANEARKLPTRMPIASALFKAKDLKGTIRWLRKILDANPLDQWAAQLLIHCLWETRGWREAAIFLNNLIERVGEKPGLLIAYGRSLLEARNFDEAVTALGKAGGLAGSNIEARDAATKLLFRAIELGGTPKPQVPDVDPRASVTAEEFERALRDYGRSVSDARMRFWKKTEADHKWTPSPEWLAQGLLHFFLDGTFGKRISVIEEVSARAGRIDIYVLLIGGLSAIVELKMCGAPYSSTYAAAGEDQILHYMENKGTHLGYLVVLDARANDSGKPLIDPPNPDRFSIVEILADVRPYIDRKRSKAKSATRRPKKPA